MSQKDRDLVARVVATGDHHAFAVLVRRHQSAVRALLRRLTAGDEATADDLAQETFLKAYGHLDRYRGEAKLSTWLYRIAYHLFVSHVRRRREALPLDAGPEPVAESSPSTLARHDLNRALGCLGVEERAAIALTFGRDLTHEEAAEILGIPVGTLKTHVARAKEKLRKRLKAWKHEAVS